MSEWASHLQKAPDNGKTPELSWNQHLLAFGLRVWANLFRDLDWACGLSFVHVSGRERRPSLTCATLPRPSPAMFPHSLLIKPLCASSSRSFEWASKCRKTDPIPVSEDGCWDRIKEKLGLRRHSVDALESLHAPVKQSASQQQKDGVQCARQTKAASQPSVLEIPSLICKTKTPDIDLFVRWGNIE